MRSPDLERLVDAENRLAAFLDDMRDEGSFSITETKLAGTNPVRFDDGMVRLIERMANARGCTVRRMTSVPGMTRRCWPRSLPRV